MKKRILLGVALVSVVWMSVPAQAAISWADLLTVDGRTVYGSLAVDSQTVDVTITNSANYGFVQTSGGIYYWTQNPANPPYTVGAVDYAPPTSDIVALSAGGSVTVAFSQAVTNPVLGLVSWNGNTADFGAEISFLSYGRGYWGTGTPIINAGGTGFSGSGEVHGLVELPGTFTSFTFTNTSEYWHGFTVGAEGVADSTPAIPVPAAAWLLGSGLLSLAAVRRKVRQ